MCQRTHVCSMRACCSLRPTPLSIGKGSRSRASACPRHRFDVVRDARVHPLESRRPRVGRRGRSQGAEARSAHPFERLVQVRLPEERTQDRPCTSASELPREAAFPGADGGKARDDILGNDGSAQLTAGRVHQEIRRREQRAWIVSAGFDPHALRDPRTSRQSTGRPRSIRTKREEECAGPDARPS